MLSTRDITKLCFFACIFYVLAINGNWARTPDYRIFTATIDTNTQYLKSVSNRLLIYTREEAERPGRRERLAPFLEKMELVRSRTDSVFEYLEQLKINLNSTGEENKRSKTGSDLIDKKISDSLRKTLDAYFEFLINSCGAHEFRAYFDRVASKHWQDELLFKNLTPQVVNCILSVLQNDICSNEYQILTQLTKEYGDTGGGYHSWPVAIAIPNPSFVLPGQKARGEILIASYNKAINPTIKINTGNIVKIEYAVGRWEKKNSPLGLNSASGTASLIIDTHTVTKSFSFGYFVCERGIALNIDKANICYIGVNNPITVSVPGYDPVQLSLKVKGATVTQTAPGKYNIYFKQLPKENVYAFVEGTNDEGTTSTVASLPLKVVHLPTPRAELAGVNNGDMHVRHFRKASGLSAVLYDSYVDMDYTIVSYKLSLFHDHNSVYIEPVTGKGDFRNNPKILKILDIARKGDRAIFEDIIARDANGRNVELAPMMLKLY